MITCPFTRAAWRAGGGGGGAGGDGWGGGEVKMDVWPELALVMTAHAPHFWSFL